MRAGGAAEVTPAKIPRRSMKITGFAMQISLITGQHSSSQRWVRTSTPFMLHLYASLTEKERRLISERTSAAPRRKGFRQALGEPHRPCGRASRHPEHQDLTGTGTVTLKANADAFAERVLPMIADAQRRGHTRAIAAELERLHVKTARGGSTLRPRRKVADIALSGLDR
jgi:DNA invertase Pin-like site-specific DNA recombinase